MTLRFTLRQLEYFVATGEAGSISAAAKQVNISPPSISAAISQIEEGFGVQLFVRLHSHGLRLTPGGRRFFALTKDFLQSAEHLNRLAHEIHDEMRGPLELGCFTSLAALPVAELRAHFEALHPAVAVSQRTGHQAQILELLRQTDIEIAITYNLQLPPFVDFEAIFALKPYVFVPPGHKFADRTDIKLAEIADQPFILLDMPLSSRYLHMLFEDLGLKPNIAERVPDIATMQGLVANGFGFGIANTPTLNRRAPDGQEIRRIPLASNPRPLEIGVATVRGLHLSRPAHVFREYAREHIPLILRARTEDPHAGEVIAPKSQEMEPPSLKAETGPPL